MRRPPLHHLPQPPHQRLMPLHRLHDAHVRQPIPHHGQQLVHVVDVGGDEQGAVGVQALLLARQQGAAGEIVGHVGAHAQQHFGGAFGEPHVVLGVDVFLVRGLGVEAAGFVHLQAFDQGHAEVFQPAGFLGGQVPHAVLVDEAVGLGLAGLGFVGEAALLVLLDGGLQCAELRALRAQVFVGRGLHMGAAAGFGGIQLFQQVAQAGVGEQVLGASQAGIAVQMAGGDGAARGLGQLPAVVFRFFHDALQARAQVALDGAYAHAEVFHQLVLVQGLALVQAGQDAR